MDFQGHDLDHRNLRVLRWPAALVEGGRGDHAGEGAVSTRRQDLRTDNYAPMAYALFGGDGSGIVWRGGFGDRGDFRRR